jgi:hypothetical protein
MGFRSEVYVEVVPVATTWLKWLGQLFALGAPPVHTRLYWGIFDGSSYSYFMTELTSDVPAPGGKIVGRGDGYSIQVTPVSAPVGARIDDCVPASIRFLAEAYGSVERGDLNGSFFERDWYDEPQKYGGPMYDTRNTSNTYVYWLLSKCCSVPASMPGKPSGAIGWGSMPKFPGPKRTRGV